MNRYSPLFSSGPCRKHPNWLTELDYSVAGRSHRSNDCKNLIVDVSYCIRDLLKIPKDFQIGFISGGATGAMESLLWNLVGCRPVSVVVSCLFSSYWYQDIIKELNCKEVKQITCECFDLPDLSNIDFQSDVVFTWTGTTTGVSVNSGHWIKDNRTGLTICDATSAAFCVSLPWGKLDATAFSWQKGLGGEGGHGVIVLSPRAISRLKSFIPSRRAIPRIFQITNESELSPLFFGSPINTPSMLCFLDYLNALKWAIKLGGLEFLVNKVKENYDTVLRCIENQNLFAFAVRDQNVRARNVHCLIFRDAIHHSPSFLINKLAQELYDQKIAFDIIGPTKVIPNIRIWGGPTINTSDLKTCLSKIISVTSRICKKS